MMLQTDAETFEMLLIPIAKKLRGIELRRDGISPIYNWTALHPSEQQYWIDRARAERQP